MIENTHHALGIARRIIRPAARATSMGEAVSGDGCPWDIRGRAAGHSRGILHQSPSATIGFTRCCPHDDCRGPEHLVGAHVVTFPRSGVFVMHGAGDSFLADPNGVIFSNRADVFRTSHPGARGDDTLWLSPDPGIIAGALSRFDPAAAEREERPFSFPYGPCEPRTFLLHQALRLHCQGPAPDPLLISEQVCALVDQAVTSACGLRGVRPAPARARNGAAHRDIAEGVKRVLALRYAERITIGEIAGAVGSSPFHVCRVFRCHAGLPIHRYLNRLRLRAAIEGILDRGSSLADLAVAVGFASHSHFSDAFRREFGTPPSAVRESLAR